MAEPWDRRVAHLVRANSEALHLKHGTSGALRSPRLVWAFYYGMFRFYRSHYAPQRSRLVSAIVYARIGVRALGTLLVSLVARPALALTARD